MTIRNDISINWNVSPRIIEVSKPSVELTIQDLYDTVRSLAAVVTYEDEITDASGKEELSITESVGLTIKLFNAKVKFEDRTSPTDCNIFGGNLVALNENNISMNPIQYATYVTVTYAKSSSASLINMVNMATKTDIQGILDEPVSNHHQIGSFGEHITKKVLTTNKFIALK